METIQRRPRMFLIFIIFIFVLALISCGQTERRAAPVIETEPTKAPAPAQASEPEATATPAPTQTLEPTTTATAEPIEKEAPTPSPTPSPSNSPDSTGCTNDSAFVTDVTVPDNTLIEAGEAFTKIWRLRNTGSCHWTTEYQFTFVGDEQMSASSSNVNLSAVSPGETYDLAVDFNAPLHPGIYRSTWQLKTPDGDLFGVRPYVQIEVEDPVIALLKELSDWDYGYRTCRFGYIGEEITIADSDFEPNATLPLGIYIARVGEDELRESRMVKINDQGEFEIQIQTTSFEAGKYTAYIVSPPNPEILENYQFVACIELFNQENSPADAVREYYSSINNREYETAWAELSNHFKEKFVCCTQDGKHDFGGYVEWWNSVERVNVGEVSIVEQSDNTATVLAQLSYLLKDGRTISDTRPHIQLTFDASTSKWLFFDKW